MILVRTPAFWRTLSIFCLGAGNLSAALRTTVPRAAASSQHDGASGLEVSEGFGAAPCAKRALRPRLGAPPVWPCKELARRKEESKLMTYLDKWNSSSEPGIVLAAIEELAPKGKKGLGRLSGAQPFAFGHLIASSVGIVREMERPVDNQVVMERGELDGLGFGHPTTVVIDGDRFVMFYHMEKHGVAGRAESTDGIHWESRQRVNISQLHLGTDFCVLLDKYEKNPQFRWKMTANCKDGPDLVCFFSSANGLIWTQHGARKHIYGGYADTLACLKHDTPGKDYELIMRYEVPNPALEGRGIRGSVVLSGPLDEVLRSVHEKVRWKPTERARLLLDGEAGDAEMFRRQVYSLSRTRLSQAGYLGIAQVFEFAERSHNETDWVRDLQRAQELGLEDEYDSVPLYFMPSRDGVHFDPSWVYAGAHLLPEDMTSGHHFFSQAGDILTHEGFHWLYYDRNTEHHNTRWKGQAQIMLARFLEGRMVRLRPVQETGVLATRAFVFDPDRRLSLDVLSWSESSTVTAELLPAGRSASDRTDLLAVPAAVQAAPLRGVNGSAAVEWLGNTSEFRGRLVHLRLGVSGAYLYGFKLDEPRLA